jgi:hypothetical protein
MGMRMCRCDGRDHQEDSEFVEDSHCVYYLC